MHHRHRHGHTEGMSKVMPKMATRPLCDSTGCIEGNIGAWLQGAKASTGPSITSALPMMSPMMMMTDGDHSMMTSPHAPITVTVKVGTVVGACWGAITGRPNVVRLPGHTEVILQAPAPDASHQV